MEIAKITLFNGKTFYTDKPSFDALKRFCDRAHAKYGYGPPEGARNQVDLIEMTPEEYQAIPATTDSAELFKP